MKKIGVLWDEEISWEGDKPYNGESDDSYSLFSKRAEQKEVQLIHGHYQWYSEGKMEKAWIYDEEWKQVEDVEVDGIFDKFHFTEETKKLKQKMNEEVGILNNPELEELCKDKILTYQRFPDLMPETREFSDNNAKEMLDKYGKIVLKPRFAFGGKGIHIVEDRDEIPEIEEAYIIQEFVDSSGGIDGIVEGTHDLRGILVNGELRAGYVRYSDGEISNVSQGGSQHAVSPEEFPEAAKDIIEEVNSELEYSPSLFSVDIFFDKQENSWIVELNSKPGIGYYGDEEMKEQLVPVMDSLVNAFKQL